MIFIKGNKTVTNILLSFLVITSLLYFFLYPVEIIGSCKSGMILFYENVFPTLFPFMVALNILTALGMIVFIGTFLGPLMEKWFGVSGSCGFPLISGFTSGFPMGAKITSSLYKEKIISKVEAQKILAYSNNCGPLFILGVVGIGMYQNISLGYVILVANYASAIILGLLINFLYPGKKHFKVHKKDNIFKKSYYEMEVFLNSKENKGVTFGKILSSSVSDAITSTLVIGGFIIIFSVVSGIMQVSGVLNQLSYIFTTVIPLNVDQELVSGFFLGVMEITTGVFKISQNPTYGGILLTTGLITFGGFSIHAQSINFISTTDLKVSLYLLGKFCQSIISFFIVSLLLSFTNIKMSQNVFLSLNSTFGGKIKYQSISFFAVLFVFLLISLAVFFLSKKNKTTS